MGMPVRGCGETPNPKTKRCTKHPKESQGEGSGVQDGAYSDLACKVCKKTVDATEGVVCQDEFGHGCNRVFHPGCVDVTPEAVTEVSWFCPDCVTHPKTAADTQMEDDALERGRTRSRTRSQTTARAENNDVWAVEKIVGMKTNAKVRRCKPPPPPPPPPYRSLSNLGDIRKCTGFSPLLCGRKTL